MFVCRGNFLEGRFVLDPELSDLVEESNKHRTLQMEGNIVDDFVFAFCLFPKCHGSAVVEDGLAKGACFPDVILDLGKNPS